MSHTRVEMNSSEQSNTDDDVFPWPRTDVYSLEIISTSHSCAWLLSFMFVAMIQGENIWRENGSE